MSDHRLSCPGCSSAIPARAVALELQLECPTCLTRLGVPVVYQANVLVASFVLGLGAAWLLGAAAHFVEATFLLAFVFAVFLGTTVVPLVPPKLQIR
jgi:hypothetical protein